MFNELLEQDSDAVDFLEYSGEKETYRNRLNKARENPEYLERDKVECYSKLLYTTSRREAFDYSRIGHKIGLSGCILIIGAGFSYASHVHITTELGPLMQEVFEVVRANRPEVKIPEKSDPRDCDHWKIIKQEASEFRSVFKSKNEAKYPSSQHKCAWEMFSDNRIKQIVSFNWDDLIEKASGFKIPKVNSTRKTYF